MSTAFHWTFQPDHHQAKLTRICWQTLKVNHSILQPFQPFLPGIDGFWTYLEVPVEANPVPIPGVPAEAEVLMEEPQAPEPSVEEVDPQFGVSPEGKTPKISFYAGTYNA